MHLEDTACETVTRLACEFVLLDHLYFLEHPKHFAAADAWVMTDEPIPDVTLEILRESVVRIWFLCLSAGHWHGSQWRAHAILSEGLDSAHKDWCTQSTIRTAQDKHQGFQWASHASCYLQLHSASANRVSRGC